ncbi:hypothetical protein HN873_010910 [Arachis hypogaea]
MKKAGVCCLCEQSSRNRQGYNFHCYWVNLCSLYCDSRFSKRWNMLSCSVDIRTSFFIVEYYGDELRNNILMD